MPAIANRRSTPKEIVGSHGHRPHGKSILWPALYEHLCRKGYSKEKAARISNAAWKKKRRGRKTNTTRSVRGVVKQDLISKRKVRTAAGSRLYDLPIGSTIIPGRRKVKIKEGDIDRAERHLGRGNKVELATTKDAATLVTKLGKMAEEAQKSGTKAKDYDLCKVSVAGTNLFCRETKGVKRIQMPQLTGPPTPGTNADKLKRDARGNVDLSPGFRKMLRAQGRKLTASHQPAASLKASQMELNGGKVAGIMNAMERGVKIEGRVFISKDNYIIDGHHRWAALIGLDTKDGSLGDIDMKVEQVDMGIMELLKLANDYAIQEGIPQAAVHKSRSDMDFQATGDIIAKDDDRRLVFGWAYVMSADGEEVVDKSGEFFDDEAEIEEMAYSFVQKSRIGGDWHKRDDNDVAKAASTMVESMVFTEDKKEALGLPGDFPTGWWVGFKVEHDDVWKAVKKGEYKAFSIHGRATKKEVGKALGSASTSATISQSYEQNPDGTKKWRLSMTNNQDHIFDSFEEAVAWTQNNGVTISKVATEQEK